MLIYPGVLLKMIPDKKLFSHYYFDLQTVQLCRPKAHPLKYILNDN